MVGAAHRILTVLSERPRDAFTILQVARVARCSRGNAKVTLHRLAKAGTVARVGRGLYQHPSGLVYPGAPDPRLRIHALKLECRCNQLMGWPFRRVLRKVTSRFASPALHRHPKNHSITTRGEWNARRLTITAHPDETGLLEVFMESSSLPLHLVEVHAYVSGFIPGAFDIPAELWTVKQADWNIDIPGSVKNDLSLNGISVAGFEKLILKIYQKAEDLVRAEVRTFEPVMVGRLVEYLESILFALADVQDDGELAEAV